MIANIEFTYPNEDPLTVSLKMKGYYKLGHEQAKTVRLIISNMADSIEEKLWKMSSPVVKPFRRNESYCICKLKNVSFP